MDRMAPGRGRMGQGRPMFQRHHHLRWLLCGAGLWTVSIAAAQSNQPIDISSAHFPVQGSRVQPVDAAATGEASGPEEPAAVGRITSLVRRLAQQQPSGPDIPAQTVTAAQTLGPSDRAGGHLPTDAAERLTLGTPGGLDRVDHLAPATTKLRESDWVVKTLSALGLVVGLILLLRAVLGRLVHRSGTVATSALLEVLGRVNVAPRHQVLLVRVGGRILVVGDNTAGLRTLADIDDPEEVAGLLAAVAASKPHSVSRSFTQLLDRFNGDFRDDHRRQEEGGDSSEYRVDRTRDRLSQLVAHVRSMSSRGGGMT